MGDSSCHGIASSSETVAKSVTHVSGLFCYLCLRTEPAEACYSFAPVPAALESLFQLQARGSTLAREVRGGLATFLTMAYILFANPSILSGAGIPAESARRQRHCRPRCALR